MSSPRRVAQAAAVSRPRSTVDGAESENLDAQADDEEARADKPLLKGKGNGQSQGFTPSYGATDRQSTSPEAIVRNSILGRVPEEQEGLDVEEPDEIEYELEERDLYSGSYRRIVALYSFVPLSSFLVFVLLAALPGWVWPAINSPSLPHAPYFPSPLPEFLLSAALWSLTHLVRVPLYTLFSGAFQILPSVFVTILFQGFYALVYNLLRISALPILRLRHQMDFPLPTCHDFAFHRVWWLALGWAATETTVAIVQEYAQIALYKDVMIPEEKLVEAMAQAGSGSGSRNNSFREELLPLSPRAYEEPPSASRRLNEAIELEVDRDLEQLVNLKEREELEEIYGLPIIRIPVFVSCLQRIDSIIITLGITLILSASYLRSHMSLFISVQPPSQSSNLPFIVAFPSILLLNAFLSILYTPLVLPHVGVHTAAYIGFLVGLGCLFTGLGLWGALS